LALGVDRVQYMIARAKIHRARVTECRMAYEGSVSIDAAILRAAGIRPWEVVQITNYANGTLWRTYVIPAEAGSGTIALNGPPARLFAPGDHVTILAFVWAQEGEWDRIRPRVTFVDADGRNTVQRVEEHTLDWP
jgi:aspartate 1-decarboxylase